MPFESHVFLQLTADVIALVLNNTLVFDVDGVTLTADTARERTTEPIIIDPPEKSIVVDVVVGLVFVVILIIVTVVLVVIIFLCHRYILQSSIAPANNTKAVLHNNIMKYSELPLIRTAILSEFSPQ